MKIKIFSLSLIFSMLVPAMSLANSGQLMLDKVRLDIHIGIGDSACDEVNYIDIGRNVPDMRRFPCYARTGKYNVTLTGAAGTTLTLFGSFTYGSENGFLVIRKKDDSLVWILHLEDFPNGKWSTQEANNISGAFDVFYSAAPIFEQNVSSIKWGQWWQGELK
jgi:hypothetical protein